MCLLISAEQIAKKTQASGDVSHPWDGNWELWEPLGDGCKRGGSHFTVLFMLYEI